jgi:hypothetical protein
MASGIAILMSRYSVCLSSFHFYGRRRFHWGASNVAHAVDGVSFIGETKGRVASG